MRIALLALLLASCHPQPKGPKTENGSNIDIKCTHSVGGSYSFSDVEKVYIDGAFLRFYKDGRKYYIVSTECIVSMPDESIL